MNYKQKARLVWYAIIALVTITVFYMVYNEIDTMLDNEYQQKYPHLDIEQMTYIEEVECANLCYQTNNGSKHYYYVTGGIFKPSQCKCK